MNNSYDVHPDSSVQMNTQDDDEYQETLYIFLDISFMFADVCFE